MSKRAQIIATLVSSGHALTYIDIADRLNWTYHYSNTVCQQMLALGQLVVDERLPGRFRPRSGYRPTPKGLRLLDENYVAQRDGAIKREAEKRERRGTTLWEAWR